MQDLGSWREWGPGPNSKILSKDEAQAAIAGQHCKGCGSGLEIKKLKLCWHFQDTGQQAFGWAASCSASQTLGGRIRGVLASPWHQDPRWLGLVAPSGANAPLG